MMVVFWLCDLYLSAAVLLIRVILPLRPTMVIMMVLKGLTLYWLVLVTLVMCRNSPALCVCLQ